ncbi:MAG: hypothetical protein IJN21_02350 [Clostridia bacterium]|nr:hypothetical protein [Clostridia bacterium]
MVKFRRILLLFLLFACMCLLTGCLKNEVLDQQMNSFIDAYNQKDAQSIHYQSWQNGISIEQLESVIEKAYSMCGTIDKDAMKLVSVNIRSQSANGIRYKSYEGTYHFTKDGANFALELTYITTESNGSGLARFNLYPIAESLVSFSSTSIVYLITCIIHSVGIILTIIDVIRKKRKKAVLWILLSLLYVRLNLSPYSILLPVGSIIYWCIRKNLKTKLQISEETSANTDREEESNPTEETDQEASPEQA